MTDARRALASAPERWRAYTARLRGSRRSAAPLLLRQDSFAIRRLGAGAPPDLDEMRPRPPWTRSRDPHVGPAPPRAAEAALSRRGGRACAGGLRLGPSASLGARPAARDGPPPRRGAYGSTPGEPISAPRRGDRALEPSGRFAEPAPRRAPRSDRPDGRPGHGAPAVRVAGSATLDGAPLFGPLDIAPRRGRWTCLLGASGVGKSTVLRLIAGLPTGAAFDGTRHRLRRPRRSTAASPTWRRRDLLFPWLDVLGNVVLGARLRGERPDTRPRPRARSTRVGLGARADRRPRTLSGGERQRVALARTLMEDRPVILLDEPFSALDASTRAEMQELAAGLLAGRTVLLVTHDPAEAARLGHAILLMTPTGVTAAPRPAGAAGARPPTTPRPSPPRAGSSR